MESGPRIYVACLASYNAGHLHGRWLDAAQEVDELREEIELMLEDSPIPHAEEWAIHDYEGFSPLTLDEHEDLSDVVAAAKLIAEHGPIAAHVLSTLGGLEEVDEARQTLEDKYIGAYGSLADWIEECLDEGLYGPVNEKLRPYLDTERMGRDAELGGDIDTYEVEGELHLFWSR